MLAMFVPVMFAALPAAYEVDFGALDKAVPPYNFVIVLGFKGEPDVKVPWFSRRQKQPAEWADGLMESLNDPRWKLKKNGDRIIIYGYDDVLIHRVTVEGEGAKPVVRRVPYVPSEKKNR